jgi:hypothetical protein
VHQGLEARQVAGEVAHGVKAALDVIGVEAG